MTGYWRSLQSEWLKRKRSLASWMIVGGGLFTPAILLAFRLSRAKALPPLYAKAGFWEALWTQAWESVAVMLLPMFVIVATSLVVQIESRNNAWKQLHASPQPLTTVFLAKLTVVLVLLAQFFVVLNAGIYVAGVLPAVLLPGVPCPASPIPWALFAARNLRYFLDSLPIVASQYLLALRFKNALVPVGAGMAIWLGSVGLLSWRYSYLLPYSHSSLDYLITAGHRVGQGLPASLQAIALLGFGAFSLVAYVGYLTARDRG